MAGGKLSQEELRAVWAMVDDPRGKPQFQDADWIGVCNLCNDTQVSLARWASISNLCGCGGIYSPAPHMDALVAAFRIGGWEAVVAACRSLLEEAKVDPP